MFKRREARLPLLIMVSSLLVFPLALGGVNKDIQNTYVNSYKNKALYLKIPLHGFRQSVLVDVPGGPKLDPSSLGQPLAFKVGDQIRVTDLDFKDDSIRFKVASIDLSRVNELVFQFRTPLDSEFALRGLFDRALGFALTEGTNYQEIEGAKDDFIANQFDQLIRQFAETTGTSDMYVIETISERNPEFSRVKEALTASENRVKDLREQVQQEAAARQKAEQDLVRTRSQVSDSAQTTEKLRAEITALQQKQSESNRELQNLRAEKSRWESQQRELQGQVRDLLSDIDDQNTERTQLGSRVESLTNLIDTLKKEQARLMDQAESNQTEIADLKTENGKLSRDLRSLTSNKNSINSLYLEVKREKENFEQAQVLQNSFKLVPQAAPEQSRSYELYLMSQSIGTLSIRPPTSPDSECRVDMELSSPELVKFSEEERALYSSLGDKVRAEVRFLDTAGLEAVPADPDLVRELAAREKAEWSWGLRGELSESRPVRLEVNLLDSNDHRVLLWQGDFPIQPGGMPGLLKNLPYVWIVASFALGAIAMLLFRGRTTASSPSSRGTGLPPARNKTI